MTMARPRIGQAELFLSYRRGWRDGAIAAAMRGPFVEHHDARIREAYRNGYDAGRDAAARASARASHLYDYVPSILREAADD